MEFDEFKRLYDREVVKQMRDNKVPGFSALITKGGEVVYDRSFGNREWKDGLPANKDTLYGIASITKSMTALGILILQEQGKLHIDDEINKYIPVHLDKYEGNPIRIRHLMSHASGIPNLGSYGAQIKNEELTTFNTNNLPMGNWDDFYFNLNDAEDWIHFEPGSRFYYNNDGYTMLSRIIATVSQMEYEEFMAEYVLEPLGMTRSTFSRKEVEEDDNHASGYSSDPTDNGMTRKPKPHLSGPFQSGAGGLNSSVQELTNYLTMHLNKGKIGDTQIISETILQEMYKPHNQHIRSDDLFLTQSKSVYGFGLSIVDFYGYTLITHGGASGVAGGVVAFIPELNITYAHLYNVGWFSSHMMHIALCYLIGKDPYETLPFLPRREHYKKLSGTYSTYRNLTTITVKMINGLLSFEGGFMSKVIFPLVPVTPEETKPMHFHTYTEFGRQLVAFTELEDGNIIIEIERNIYHKNQYSDDLEPFK